MAKSRIPSEINKLAKKCHEIMRTKLKMSRDSSSTPLLCQVSVHWRSAMDATNYKGDLSGGWKEKELSAAHMIIASYAYLEKIGCADPERLIKESLRSMEEGCKGVR